MLNHVGLKKNNKSKENNEKDPFEDITDNYGIVQTLRNKRDNKLIEGYTKFHPKCCVPKCNYKSGKVFRFPKDERVCLNPERLSLRNVYSFVQSQYAP